MIERRWQVAMVILIAVLGVFLIAADKPWDEKLQRDIAKREAAGKLWKTEHYATYYLWWAAAGNLVVAGALLAATRWWAKPLTEGPAYRFDHFKLKGRARRWFLAGVGAAVVVAAVYRVPRLGHSFWNDEEYAFRTYTWGQGVEQEDGSLKFEPVSWEDSLFRNKVNNHLVCTVTARFSHAVWKTFAGEDATFSEAALRILPMLASLGSIALVAVFLGRIGSPVAGVATAFFLALDPWHIRYSVELRGYAWVLLFLTLSMVFLLRALGKGRGRDWILYAVAQAFAFLSFPGIVFELALQNGIALVILLYQKKPQNAGRLLVANILSGMAAVQVMLPSVPQVSHYLKTTDEKIGNPGLSWVRDWWSHAVEGIPWSSEEGEDLHHGVSVLQEAANDPGAYLEVVLIVPALAVIGLIFVALRYPIVLMMVASLLGGSALSFANAVASNTVFYSWYVIYSVIAVAVLASFGVNALALLGRRKFFQTHIALQVLFLFLYALLTTGPRQRIVKYDRQPLRQAVGTVRGESPAFSEHQKDTLTASFGTSRGMITSYDPRNTVLKNLKGLEEVIVRAEREQKPLFIYHCGRRVAQRVPADKAILDRIEQNGDFEKIAYLKGLEELFSYHIFKYQPAAAKEVEDEN